MKIMKRVSKKLKIKKERLLILKSKKSIINYFSSLISQTLYSPVNGLINRFFRQGQSKKGLTDC